ncbi:MAG: putative oxidoreductases (related to aryl-alcohol dehydrogenases) [uncultured Acidilobus sp. OSP8]|jgi:Predicted oxidoreductases (related to aryl-alcohol dehydrogenases)|nr:MAG: putative oxidoreductases (related to aryl-alcohol dehydrogenases) [uncultured Acidilobus sp. OSP8]
MKYVRLGWSGVKVSALCLGTWHLPPSQEVDEYGVLKVDVDEALKAMRRAYDLGVNFIDTANRYHGVMQPVDINHVGNAERIVGRFLVTVDRESVVIATKVRGQMAPWPNGEGLSRKHVMWQARESLRRLGTDYIDLYQLHWPDPETPKLESLRALQDLVRMGLVHYTGVSNHPAHDVVEFLELADRIGADRFVSMQEKYNVIERGIEVDGRLDVARRYGLAVLAYSPLAQGVLTGKYYDFKEGRWVVPELSRASLVPDLQKRYFNERTAAVLRAMKEVADSKGITMAQLALAWVLKRSERLGVTIIPITSFSRASQVDEAVEAVNVSLKDDDVKAIEEALRAPRSYD